ncbi:MAG: class I SAM-dependent methyltransferase [Bacteroidota bacterium]
MNPEKATTDKAGEDYWSSFWKSAQQLPAAASLSGKSDNAYLTRQYDAFYSSIFKKKAEEKKRILEIGCGNSVWLSFFQKEYGFQVFGLDYSEFGCEQTRKILERDGCTGEIRRCDLFAPPADWLGTFDVVCSFGVVEHFTDTAEVIRSISRFLKPGGILITTIPNLNGPTGWLQKVLYRQVYDIHVVMDKQQLNAAVSKAGLSEMTSSYFCTLSFGVALETAGGKPVHYKSIKKMLVKCFQLAGRIFRFIDDSFVRLPKGKYSSEGIINISKLKG